jgi:hypothetical protein
MLSHPGAPSIHNTVRASLIAAALLLAMGKAGAFVFLDTSGPQAAPKDSIASTNQKPVPAGVPAPAAASPPESAHEAEPRTSPQDKPAGTDAPDGAAGLPNPDSQRRGPRPAHYGNVLFLSSDTKIVYAYLGVLKAMEEFGLAPDAVLAESKSVLVGAAWALGYDAADLERLLERRPLEQYLRPEKSQGIPDRPAFRPEAPEAPQWEIPIGLENLQAPGAKWTDVTFGETGEYLRLSWLIAKLTHDAPGGPVDELSGTARPLAVQAADLAAEKPAVLTEGSLQNILKGSLLPDEVVRRRQRLWPYASGSLVSGHSVMGDRLPFTCDRIIVLQPGHRLRPPALEGGRASWTDTLNLRARRSLQSGAAASGSAKTLVVELEPDGEFNPSETDPRRWISLGYTSALRSMDVLQSVLASRKAERRSPPREEDKLGLDRNSVNPLASGDKQLLLDIVRTTDGDPGDTLGDGAVQALVRSGWYSDLDLEWSHEARGEKAVMMFDAREKSRISLRAGFNFALDGEELPDRPPEIYGGLAWSEPFYIPFEAEAGALLGGHMPGYEARAMIAPVYPLRLQLGATLTHWEEKFSFTPPAAARHLGAGSLRVNRTLSELFLKLFAARSAWLRTAVQKHEMELPDLSREAEPPYLSTDFEGKGFLGLGKGGAAGEYPLAMQLRYRNLNRVNTAGQLRRSTSTVESHIRLRWRDFRITDQYYWSDQDRELFNLYDLMETGAIDAFTFQDEYFLSFLRSINFQDVRLEYCPSFGKWGLWLIAGGYHNYGPILYAHQSDYKTINGITLPFRAHWEAQVGYATPIGALRVGMAGLEDDSPFFYMSLGCGLELGFENRD